MNQSINNSAWQETFAKLFLGWLIISGLSWTLSFWITSESAFLLSVLTVASLGYFHLPNLKKLGLVRWTTIVLTFLGCYFGIKFGNSYFGESKLWGGFASAFLGFAIFLYNCFYFWLLKNDLKIKNEEDLITPKIWLLSQSFGSLALIIIGVFVAFGVF